MSRSFRIKTPTFRFNRNEDDLLEEVMESNEAFVAHKPETNDSINHTNGSQQMDSSLLSDTNVTPISGSGVSRERSTVKDFITSRLNKTKSLDEESGKESNITSNWFNEIKGKFKEKIDERKRVKESKQLNPNELIDKGLEPEIQSKNSLNKDLINFKTNESNDESIENNSNELSVDYENESIVSSIDYSLIQHNDSEVVNEEVIGTKPKINERIDLNNKIDCNQSTNTTESQQLWSRGQLFNTTALMIALISLIISLSLPVPPFISGLLFGFVCTIVLFSVLIFYIISNYLVVKTGTKRTEHKRNVLTVKVVNNDEIYKGWVYEFVGNYEERDSSFKVQLIYVRLQGSNLRLSKPKHDIKKSKLDSNSLPSFGSQRFFDLSKMLHKRVCLLLPKSVRNQKKYVWSKKYPICLELEDKTKNIFKLILFIRNCREKEEWFWKLKEKLNQNFYPSNGGSGPPTPNSTSEAISAEFECLPRTQSLDLGSIQSATTFSSNSSSPTSPSKELSILSKQLDFNLFMEKIVDLKLNKPSSLSSLSSLSWFNALIGRICFDILNEQFWSNYIASKIQRKLRRLRLPYFMESLTITEIDVGNTLPKFNDVPNPPVVDNRGLWIDFDITYSGGFTMTLETKLNLMKLKEQANGSQEMKSFVERSDIDLSDNESDSIMTSSDEEVEEKPVDPEDADTSKKQQKILKFVDKIASSQYFQKATENKYIKRAMEGVSKTALILTVQIQTLNGTLALNIPQPPTDRLWYGFRGNPDLVLSARPKLGEHQLKCLSISIIFYSNVDKNKELFGIMSAQTIIRDFVGESDESEEEFEGFDENKSTNNKTNEDSDNERESQSDHNEVDNELICRDIWYFSGKPYKKSCAVVLAKAKATLNFILYHKEIYKLYIRSKIGKIELTFPTNPFNGFTK